MFFGLSQIRLIAYGVVLVAFIGMGVALKVQGMRLGALQQEYKGFRTQVEAEGKAAEIKAKFKELQNKALQHKTDNENQILKQKLANTLTDLRVTTDRLRNSSTSSRNLPISTSSSSRPDLYCADRAEFEREDRIAGSRFTESMGDILKRTREIADQSSKDSIDLESARNWAKEYTKQ